MSAKKMFTTINHGTVSRIVDGDGFFVSDLTTGNDVEIRLLGIDAPEIKNCKKLRQDERECHLPGQLLIELGQASKQFVSTLVPVGTRVAYVSEGSSNYDLYGRLLAYVYLPDGRCINQEIVKAGYAKAFDKYQCDQLPLLISLNAEARREHRGNYQSVDFI